MSDFIVVQGEDGHEVPTEVDLDVDTSKLDFMHFDRNAAGGPSVICSCGQKKTHSRVKVLAAWTARHYKKTKHGWTGGGFSDTRKSNSSDHRATRSGRGG